MQARWAGVLHTSMATSIITVENEMEKMFFTRILGSKYDRRMIIIVFIFIDNTQ